MFRSNSSQKYQQQRLKGSSYGDDELVKHMSNLPVYLRREEKEENIQEKALNVGVLNWSRLENWTHRQRHVPAKGGIESSSGIHSFTKQKSGLSTLPTLVRSGTPQKYSPFCSNLNSSKKDDLPYSVNFYDHNVSRFRESESAARNSVKGHRRILSAYIPFERNHSSATNEKEKRKSLEAKITTKMVNISSNGSDAGVMLRAKGNIHVRDDEVWKKTEKLKEIKVNHRDAVGKTIVEVDVTSSKLRDGISQNDISFGSEENVAAVKTKKILNLRGIDINLSLHSPGKQGSVVHLAKHMTENSNSEALNPTKDKIFDEYFSEESSSSSSDIFSSEKNHSAEHSPDIPLSSPHSLSEANVMLDVTEHSLNQHCNLDSPSSLCQHSNEMPSLVPIGNIAKNSKSDSKLTHLNHVNKCEKLEQDTTDFESKKGRQPSPNRRFSFSLGRMGRSFTFKEGSTVPQLSSTYVAPKSGPVSCGASSGLNDLDRKSVDHTCSRGRLSPLRRLIEPIMKYRATSHVPYVEGNLNSLNFFSNGVRDSSQKKHIASRVQALMQFTVKNGLPLFKLTVDSSKDILAATIKNSSSSENDEFSQNYTFYFADEIKKRSGGLNWQGSKEKNRAYVYNAIGQMKVTCFHCFDLSGGSSNGMYKIRESVLFGVEVKPGDHDSPKIVSSKELAAIVFKIPMQKMSKDEQSSNKVESNRGFSNSREMSESDSIVVILPGGLHGSPCNGEPSPLIDRWESGGSCDCGGWDIGCKLHILLNQQKLNSRQSLPEANSITRRFELFIQDGRSQNKPIFSLEPLKNGSFSIEFCSTLSSLQAFFIAVTLLNCQMLYNHSEASTVPRQSKFVKEPYLKTSEELHVRAPARFTPIPPLSPVGRV